MIDIATLTYYLPVELAIHSVVLCGVLSSAVAVGKRSDSKCKSHQIRPIYDVYHSNYDTILAEHHYLPDLLIAATIMQWAAVANYDLVLSAMLRIIIFHSIRSSAIAATCGYVSPAFLNKSNIPVGMNANFSDLVISGHIGVSCILVFDMVYLGSAVLATAAIITILISSYINLAVGDHYTSDLIIGAAMSILISTSLL
jgi:hypothetical protein